MVGAVASSSKRTENKDLYYNGITIMIDGAEYVAKDANGNVVEPFIMDGTTYLPVRGVANAFDKDVEWDGKTSTVYIGKKDRMAPDNRLDKVQYTNYTESDSRNWMEVVNGTVTDYNNNTYTNGLINYIDQWAGGYNQIDYPLNGQYERLTGQIVLPKTITTSTRNEKNCGTSETTVSIVNEEGDELFSANGITASMPFKFDIDVDGVTMITIKVSTQRNNSYVALTDLALYE
ncbi:MAG: copper amine oxidase N-terminal domain-containing protein [Ruminococcaceae bacterium]|nr:copper amine oxidase N-terminal domain-containing protein [Oscillospiraceae bacterium]